MNSGSREKLDPRISQILDAIYKIAFGELDVRTVPSDRNDEIDAIMTGLNMLAEEFDVRVRELNRLNEELALSEQRFEAVYNSALVGIVSVDVEARRLHMVNDVFCNMVGYTRDELVGHRIDMLHEKDDLVQALAYLNDAIQGERKVYPNIRVRRKDGSIFVAEAGSSRLSLQDTTYVVGIFHDVSERKDMADELALLYQQHHAVTENVSDVLYRIDDSGRLVWWNSALQRVTGRSAAELRGLRAVELCTAADRRLAGEKFAEVLEAGQAEAEVHLNTLNGVALYHFNGVTISDHNGRMTGVAGVGRDVTEHRRNEIQLQRVNRALGALNAVDEILGSAVSEEELVQGTCSNIVEIGDYPFVWVGYVDEKGGTSLRYFASAGECACSPEHCGLLGETQEMARTPSAIAAHAGEITIVQDTENFSGPPRWLEHVREHNLRSVIALPLFSQDKVIGVLSVYSATIDAFDLQEKALLGDLARSLGRGIEFKRSQARERQIEEKVEHMAFHDALTGLPNRAMMRQVLERDLAQAKRHGGRIAVLFVDLDEFKLVNDSLGHAAGDALLRQVAGRLRAVVRTSDFVARQGGDEFVLVVSRYHHAGEGESAAGDEHQLGQEAAFVAQRILDTVKLPYVVAGQDAYVGASIGISLYPDDGTNSHDLLRHADTAMYQAKELGRGCYQFYSRGQSERQQQRLTLANGLHRAIEKEEFELLYQPIIELRRGFMVGVEALLRWRREDGTMASPTDFVPLAEETALIIPIGEWVLKEACRQIAAWERDGIKLLTAINVSARQLLQQGFTDQVLTAVEATGASRELLEIEVTESAMILDPERMEAALRQLDAEGIAIALDDFGTGFSSLHRLKHLPLHMLKIDQSFVAGLPDDRDDTAIVRATIQLAGNLGLAALAEGIETADQLHHLRRLGCQFGQGYFFSRPVEPREIAHLYRNRVHWPPTKNRLADAESGND